MPGTLQETLQAFAYGMRIEPVTSIGAPTPLRLVPPLEFLMNRTPAVQDTVSARCGVVADSGYSPGVPSSEGQGGEIHVPLGRGMEVLLPLAFALVLFRVGQSVRQVEYGTRSVARK
ncbi:hypothetical protein [Streptomyces sp. NPDC053079]|uniref:hypothetical protein n=1 Tax=Streptomyces sp. NPDC053079 TaxID=3365697 RepID=UPI0037D01D74